MFTTVVFFCCSWIQFTANHVYWVVCCDQVIIRQYIMTLKHCIHAIHCYGVCVKGLVCQ